MEIHHRRIILQNIGILKSETDYTKLLNACEKSNIISTVMKNIIENADEDQTEKHTKLFEKLTRRGPQAFIKLLKVFRNLKYTNAIKIISPTTVVDNNSKNSVSYPTKLICYDNKDIENLNQVKKSRKWNLDPKIKIYQMKSINRGVFFMVNIIDFANNMNEEKRRNGAETDGQSLLHLFNEFGFKIFYYKNLSSKVFYQLLDELINSDDMKKTECFVMALMTHGSMVDRKVDRVEFHDGAIDSVNNILDRFKNDVCPNLVQKPKIFIFPFCRGEAFEHEICNSITDSISEMNGIKPSSIQPEYITSNFSDILICYAAVPGFKTHRDPDKGSWYIQKLCEVFAEHAHDTHLEDLLKMIGENTGKIMTLDGHIQTASFTNYGFNRKLYFNPGYYHET